MKYISFPKKPNARLNIVAGLSRSKQIDSARPARRLTFQFQLLNTTGKINSQQFADAPARHSTPTGYCPHILLVDDDSYTRALNARVLTWSGYKVQTAAHGADAWKALELENYDLLITENVMPWVTGLQLLKHLRSRGVTMPVIMASNTVPTQELKRHPGLRLEAALRKPVASEKLLQTVKSILRTAGVIASGPHPVSIATKQISRSKSLTKTPQATRTKFPKRILFVDDETMIRQLHKEVLSDFGYAVELAEDGAVAWDALQINNFDLLITDNDMPKVTGIELLEKLHAARMALPVIMVSGTMPTEELKRHQLPPVEATLQKPYFITDLLKAVKHVLHTRGSSPAQFSPQLSSQDRSAVG